MEHGDISERLGRGQSLLSLVSTITLPLLDRLDIGQVSRDAARTASRQGSLSQSGRQLSHLCSEILSSRPNIYQSLMCIFHSENVLL